MLLGCSLPLGLLGLALIGGGCSSEEPPPSRITAAVTLSIAGGGELACSEGDALQLHARRTGPDPVTGVDLVVALGDCDATSLVTSALRAGSYETWLDYTNDDLVVGTSAIVLLTLEGDDEELSFEVVIDHGFVTASWHLAGDDVPVACSDVAPDIGVSLRAVATDSGARFERGWPCVDSIGQ